jgi:hypothetical protein
MNRKEFVTKTLTGTAGFLIAKDLFSRSIWKKLKKISNQ